MPETASLENVVVPGGDVRHKPQRQRPEVSAQHDILQGLDHDGAPGIGLPPPPQLGETVRFDKAVPLDVARDRGLGRIERRGATRRRHPLKAQLKEKRLLVTTLEAVLPVNGLLHDLDGLGDGKPSILLPIDTAVDKRARFRYGLDELAERAPAKQALGQLGAHRRRGGHRIAGSDHLDQRMESCAPVPCDEHASAHLPINPNRDTSCRYSQSTHGIQLISGPWLILSNANRQYPMPGTTYEKTAPDGILPSRRFPFGKVRWRARPMGIRYPG